MNNQCSHTTGGVQCPIFLSVKDAWKCEWHSFETRYHQDFEEFKKWRNSKRYDHFGENSDIYCWTNQDKTFWLMDDRFIFDALRGCSFELIGNVEHKKPVTGRMFARECKAFKQEFLIQCQAELDRYVKENPGWRKDPAKSWQNFEFKKIDEDLGLEKEDNLPF